MPKANKHIGIPKLALLAKINGAKKVRKFSRNTFTAQNIVRVIKINANAVAKNIFVNVSEFILVCIKAMNIRQGIAIFITNLVTRSMSYELPVFAQKSPKSVSKITGAQISNTGSTKSISGS